MLLERAEKIAADAHKILADHLPNDKNHVLATVQSNLNALETAINSIKQEKQAATRTSKLDEIEEHLLVSENAENEELILVREIYNAHRNPGANELIEYGNVLMNEAKIEMEKQTIPEHTEQDIAMLKFHLDTISDEVKQLENDQEQHQPDSKIIPEEDSLLFQERRLHSLLQRLQQTQPIPNFI